MIQLADELYAFFSPLAMRRSPAAAQSIKVAPEGHFFIGAWTSGAQAALLCACFRRNSRKGERR